MDNKGTILIVDDNELNLEMIQELLEEDGFHILSARDGNTSIQLAKQKHPDLILMDVYMPGKNGYETSQLLKSDPETQDIPIVAFSALAMEKDRKRAEASGCLGVISKPIDVDTFAQTVSSFLASSLADSGNYRLVQIETVSKTLEEYPEKVFLDEQKEFLMKLSHDLQAPIRKINQFSSWLRKSTEEKLSPQDQDLINGIERSTQQMQDVLFHALSEFHSGKTSVGIK